jgi:glycosyltransferase involved in cell wall biosynthesis
VDVLAKAFVTAAQKNRGLSLTLLGGGSQAGTIRKILAAGRVTDRVQYGGHVSQKLLPRWYRMADLFVSPSHVDGSSVSLLEALACGRPVLVSDIPANKEWVREDLNGWLFPDGNPDALAERILRISARRSILPRIGRAARKVAEERADWERNFAVLLRVYGRAARRP